MPETFSSRDLTDATFDHVDLTRARLTMVDLRDAVVRAADLSGARFLGVDAESLTLTGEFGALLVNGVDVVPLVQAELERREPDLARMRPTDVAGVREAWAIVGRRWADTVARARELDPALLHERVEGEWSFIETLRHLVFATDSWVGRAILGDPSPWHPLALPWEEMPDVDGVPRDRQARPGLEEVLAVRAERAAMVAGLLADLTEEQLAGRTEPVDGVGWPPPESFPVLEVLHIVLNEEWWHREYAERDLARLAG